MAREQETRGTSISKFTNCPVESQVAISQAKASPKLPSHEQIADLSQAEADYIGLLMMAEGCYRPEAAMEFWSRMDKEAQHQAPPQLLSTHPSNHNRGEKIREWMPQAHEKAEKSDCHTMASYGEYFFKKIPDGRVGLTWEQLISLLLPSETIRGRAAMVGLEEGSMLVTQAVPICLARPTTTMT
jgi:hypothetical protein